MKSKLMAVAILLSVLLFYPSFEAMDIKEPIKRTVNTVAFIDRAMMYKQVGAYENILQDAKVLFAGTSVDYREFVDTFMEEEDFSQNFRAEVVWSHHALVVVTLAYAACIKFVVLIIFVAMWRVAEKLYPNRQLE